MAISRVICTWNVLMVVFPETLPFVTLDVSYSAVLSPTVECRICTGNDCDQGGFSVLCSDGYCMENVTYHSDGSKFVTKGCSSLNDCQTYWKQNPNIIQQQCLVMMTSLSPATSNMTCRYCCNSYHCNEQMTPQNVLLFE
ncbi:mucin-5AC [Biomphalaria glabrata]